ncbi:tetratricopeptide repeat-containing diguanylate cyclase [Paenibacillus kandeliae]|uniref:tetratricopeptide repeat-containing diguanylate cyclase n=1 Tax=Paenibacillus kandeliae TaxID=3231269 RepID=UPI00345942C4
MSKPIHNQSTSPRQEQTPQAGENTAHSTRESVDLQTPEAFLAMLDTLELLPYRNVNASVSAVQPALSIAEEIGDEALLIRTKLIQADIMARQGKVAEAGRIIRQSNEWAERNGHKHILARSHRLLAGFFRRLGDNESALQHAIISVQQLPDNALLSLRADHLMMIGLTLDEVGAYEDSIKHFNEVLEIAKITDDVQLSLFALNNMAYSRCEEGKGEEAYRLATEMREIARLNNVELNASHLDTIAAIELLLGHPEKAEATLAPLVNDPLSRRLGDLSVLPECLITTAEAQRLQGKLKQAQKTLNEARHMCREQGLSGLMVRVRLQQSEMYAAIGDYRRAYEEHKLYHQENEAKRSAEREARARILQITFDAEEARRDSEYFKEMALRDPLTGLHNRRFMDPYLDELLSQSLVSGQPVTAVLIDLDHFKEINDTLSHQVGDTVLVHLAKIMSLTAPSSSALARIGGEEFLAVFKDTDVEQGMLYANRLCQAIRSADWSSITGKMPVTASLGVSTTNGTHVTRTELLSLADHNLYEAKRSGRNKVVGCSTIG